MFRFGGRVCWRLAGGSVLAGALLVGGVGLSGPVGAATHGSPYTVQFDITESGSQTLFPESPPVAKAAFHGTSGTLVTCDDQATASGNLDCEHQAVSNHVSAVIEGTSNQDQSVLTAAGIPVIGVANDTSRNSFDLSAAQSFFVGMGVALHNKGCKRVGVVIDEGGQPEAAQLAKAEKWQSVTDAYIPVTSSDVSSYVAKLAQANVQCISMASLGSQIPQILTAIKQSGLKVPIALPGVILNPQITSSLGSLSNGLLEIVSTPDPAAHSATVTKVAKEIHALDPSAKVTSAALDAWAWSKVIEDAASTIHGPVTSASMLKALNGLRNAQTDGLNPPLSMIPGPNAADKRDFDTNVLTYVLKNGKPTGTGTFLNVGTELNAATR
jgi:hypothetical protein